MIIYHITTLPRMTNIETAALRCNMAILPSDWLDTMPLFLRLHSLHTIIQNTMLLARIMTATGMMKA